VSVVSAVDDNSPFYFRTAHRLHMHDILWWVTSNSRTCDSKGLQPLAVDRFWWLHETRRADDWTSTHYAEHRTTTAQVSS